MVAYQRCLHRAWALIALLGLALAGCAYTSAPKKQELRPPTPEEAALVSELREKGVALVVDGCVFGYGPDKRSTVGLRESTAMARQYGEQIKRLLADNGIATNALVYPTVCASHRHLGSIEVAESIDQSGLARDLPIYLGEMANDQGSEALRGGYEALLDRVSLGVFRTTDPNSLVRKRKVCTWCYPYYIKTEPEIPRIENSEGLAELRHVLNSQYVLTLATGAVVATTEKRRQDKREDIAKAIVSFIFTFGMASTGETADFGESNPTIRYEALGTNLNSGELVWKYSLDSGLYQSHWDALDDENQRNHLYPLTLAPSVP